MAEAAEEQTAAINVNISEEEDILPPEDATTEEAATPAPEEEASTEPAPAESTETDKPPEVNTSWVDIIEKENNLKLLSELNKIGKLITMKDKVRELQEHTATHRLTIHPIYTQDLMDPYIVELMKLCVSTQVFFKPEEQGDGTQLPGVLDLRFRKMSDLLEHKDKLGSLREDIQLGHNLKQGEYETFTKKWRVFSRSHSNEINKLTLFAPSLPESVTEDEMWELFPAATEITLVSGTPRQHAYVKFSEEDVLMAAIQTLKSRGPPRPDFNFCRLVRFSKIVDIIFEDKKLKKPKPSTATSLARPSTSAEGQRTNKSRPPRKNTNTGAKSFDSSKPTANGKPAAKGKPDASSEDASKKKDKPQANGKPRSNRPPPSSVNPSRKGSWYRDRKNMHLERARRQGQPPQLSGRPPLGQRRGGPSPRGGRGMIDDRQQGLQVLDNLLTSLGQLSANIPALNTADQPRGRPRNPAPRSPRTPRSTSGQRGGPSSSGQRGPPNRGPQNTPRSQQNTPRSQQNTPRSQQTTPRGQQSSGRGQQDQRSRPTTPRGGMPPPQQSPGGQGKSRRRRKPRGADQSMRSATSYNYPSSPVKRSYPSMDSLPRGSDLASHAYPDTKRRRDDYPMSRPASGMASYGGDGYRSSYGGSSYGGSAAAATYTETNAAGPKGSYDGRYSRQGASSGSSSYNMLAALSSLTRQAESSRGGGQSDSRYSSSSYSQMPRQTYDRSSYLY